MLGDLGILELNPFGFGRVHSVARDVSIIQAYSTCLPEGCSSFAKCVFQAYFGW